MSVKAIESIKKQFGTDKVWMASEVPEVEVVTSGSIAVDFATGIGGFPRGSVIEIFGPESIGKTTLSYYAIAAEQKKGRLVAFVNLEGKFNGQWAHTVAGVDLDNLLLVSPDPGTESITALGTIVNSGAFGLVVFDSIGAMLGDKEQDPEEKQQAGGQSRLVTHMAKVVTVPASRNNCTVLFLNQVRDVFGATVTMYKSPGGHAVKHAASMRVQLKPTRDKFYGIVDGTKKEIGYKVSATFKKNKLATPKRIAEYIFWTDAVEENGYKLGIDHGQEILDLTSKLGIIERGGSQYRHPSFPDGKIDGKDAMQEYILGHEDVLDTLRKELMSYARGNNASRNGSTV